MFMKVLALDLGDKWIGSAISDALGITCRPHKTVEITETENFLEKTIREEEIGVVVIGKPTTFGGQESDQTKKIIKTAKKLETKINPKFDNKIKWVLWDERLSSKRAATLKPKRAKNKEEKIKSHSIAAAFILQSYLDNQALY